MTGVADRVESALALARRGFGAGIEEIVIAALVALPFSGTLAILLGAMGLPGAFNVLVAGLAQGFATFWIAGYRRRGNGDGDG